MGGTSHGMGGAARSGSSHSLALDPFGLLGLAMLQMKNVMKPVLTISFIAFVALPILPDVGHAATDAFVSLVLTSDTFGTRVGRAFHDF